MTDLKEVREWLHGGSREIGRDRRVVSGTIWNKEAQRSTRPVSTRFHCFRRAHSLASPSCHLCSASAPQVLDTTAFALPPLLTFPPTEPPAPASLQLKLKPGAGVAHWQSPVTGKKRLGSKRLACSAWTAAQHCLPTQYHRAEIPQAEGKVHTWL